MKSIKSRLIQSFLLVVSLTIIIVSAMFLIFITRYYYQGTEDILKNQVQTAAEFYEKYLYENSLATNVDTDKDIFWQQTDAQVQIYNENGVLLMDSEGVDNHSNEIPIDVKKALTNKVVDVWVGNVSYSNDRVMAISAPLYSNGKVVGAVRYITSLEVVNEFILKFVLVFIVIGFSVLIIGIGMSYFLANSIVNPLKSLTETSEEIAKGNLNVKNKIETEDEIGQLAYTLNFMAEELKKREQLKNDFISSISHELRTPLTSIKGWAITLNNENTDKEMLGVGFDIIEKEADRLSKMVEELLDFSKFVSGRIVIKEESINMIQFMNYIKSYMSPRAERENKEFIVTIPEEPVEIIGDWDRLNQVFINLIDNSFKFTEENGTVGIELINDKDHIIIVVKDSGCGISKEELPKVKEKFFKGKNSKSQNGIGLSICDEIIKLHKGVFNIESELNVGTTISIILPKERSSDVKERI
ncbi:MAG: sensor histidine kinase [Sarcina sp.]